jgi:hypothetical protein
MTHTRLVTGVIGLLIVCGGCETTGMVRRNHSIKQDDASLIVVGKERWSRFSREGWFSLIYQPEGAEIRIGISRAGNTALPPGASESTILQYELALLKRYDDSSILARVQSRLATDFGNIPCYHLQSTDHLWRLRSLVIYKDASGQIVNIGFYSVRSTIPSKIICDYLNTMFRARLIPQR